MNLVKRLFRSIPQPDGYSDADLRATVAALENSERYDREAQARDAVRLDQERAERVAILCAILPGSVAHRPFPDIVGDAGWIWEVFQAQEEARTCPNLGTNPTGI